MKKNFLIISLSLFLAAAIGFITYDSFFKPDTKCENVKCSCIDGDKTADERYKDYLTNLSKNIEKKYKDYVDIDHESLSQSSNYTSMDGNYNIRINKNKELLLTENNGKYNDYKIADNVLSFYRVHVGNGGYSAIYYITGEGKVYMSNIEMSIQNNTDITSKEVENVKNIIEVREGLGTNASTTLFIDIDGNMFTPNVAE